MPEPNSGIHIGFFSRLFKLLQLAQPLVVQFADEVQNTFGANYEGSVDTDKGVFSRVTCFDGNHVRTGFLVSLRSKFRIVVIGTIVSINIEIVCGRRKCLNNFISDS